MRVPNLDPTPAGRPIPPRRTPRSAGSVPHPEAQLAPWVIGRVSSCRLGLRQRPVAAALRTAEGLYLLNGLHWADSVASILVDTCCHPGAIVRPSTTVDWASHPLR